MLLIGLPCRLKECEENRLTTEHARRSLQQQSLQVEEQATNVEEELKVEREWRISLQDTMQQDRDRIAKLMHENGQLKIVADVSWCRHQSRKEGMKAIFWQKYATLQEVYYTLKDNCLEQEQALEELGVELRDSKLQISELREELTGRADGAWVDDSAVFSCKACKREFGLTRRKHHCRNCGDIFCHACSDNSMSLPSFAKPVRVCDDCNGKLSGHYG